MNWLYDYDLGLRLLNFVRSYSNMRFVGGLKVKQKEKVFCGHCARRGVKSEQRFDRLCDHTTKEHKGEKPFWQVIYTSLVEEDNENKVNKLQYILCNHL